MDPKDLIISTGKDGKKVRTFKSPSGVTYRLEKKFGEGGVGKVFLVTALDGPRRNQKFVLKEYPPPNDDATKKQQQRGIRQNLKTLIQKPVLDTAGQPLATMVPPLELLDFPHTGSFGYIMDYVDLSDFVSVNKLRKNFPPADIICKLCAGVSHFFYRLASGAGLCYKDINEGNIYLNPKTGDVRVIDNDNVGLPDVVTISGTGFYMAPEVQMGKCQPDKHTDRFQLATYLYRLLLGGLPYEGPKAVAYMRAHSNTIYEAGDVIFGSQATFVFDPNDKSNALASARLPADATDAEQRQHNSWQHQVEVWNRLPQVIRDNFIQTFAVCAKPEKREGRVTAQQWEKTFLDLQQTLVPCPKCKVKTFGSASSCFYCGTAFKTSICKNCGKKTPHHLSTCQSCGKLWNKPPATIKCPHCQKDNPSTEIRCKTCGKFIKVVCKKCGTTAPGNATHCAKCSTPLFMPCPSCQKQIPLDADQCAYCARPLPKTKVNCPACKRVNAQWHQKCIECGTPLPKAAPTAAPKKAVTQNLSITVLIGNQQQKLLIPYSFGSGEVIHADKLSASLPHSPLFALKYHQALKLYRLDNRSGHEIQQKAPDAGKAAIAPDASFELVFPHVVKFSDELQIRFESIR